MEDTSEPMRGETGDGEVAGRTICGATARDGGICNGIAMANGRCRMHGGVAASGMRAGNFRNGKYSKAIRKLGEDIGDRVDDPALVDPRRSMAVQEAVTARLNEMLEDRDSPEFRVECRRKHSEAMELWDSDPLECKAKMKTLGAMLRNGVEESRALSAMGESAERLNRQQTRYWHTAMAASRAIAPEEFFALLFRLGKILEEEVDKDVARRALIRVDREVCGGHLGLADGGT